MNAPHHHFDLQERTHAFAAQVRVLLKLMPATLSNIQDGKQLIRSSGSVAANYIEADESLSKKDFLYRVRICRKESKECVHWLRLLDFGKDSALNKDRILLIDEAKQLIRIFTSITRKVEVSLKASK